MGRKFVDDDLGFEDDFANYTEKELLALKGIGPVTIKKLKANGLVFKKRQLAFSMKT